MPDDKTQSFMEDALPEKAGVIDSMVTVPPGLAGITQ